ncbi:MAG: hypothetical protein JWR03_1742 [Cohnella sp.]|nr:hypothetical protein [Cohnella sp.]
MAKSITNIEKRLPNQEEEDAKAVQQLLKAVGNQRQALLGLLDVVEELQKLGVIDMMRGMLKNSKDIGEIAIEQVNKPGAHRIIKNGMAAVQFVSQVDPSKLQTLLSGLTQGMDAAVEQEPGRKHGGFWGVIKTAREPAVMSSIAMMMRFLKGMGNGLKQPTR